jgi:hypothetical protein
MITTLRKPLASAQAKVRPFTVYLPEELDRWLRAESLRESRTLTAQTIYVLQLGRQQLSSKHKK